MKNAMDVILIKLENYPKGISLDKFFALDKKKLNPFEQEMYQVLKEIYVYNSKHFLFKVFPKRDIPLVIDCANSKIKSGRTATYSGLKNKMILSHNLKGEDLKLTLIHELKHAEQWFDDTDFNNYQKLSYIY